MKFSSRRNFERAEQKRNPERTDSLLGKARYVEKTVGIISCWGGKSGKQWRVKFLDEHSQPVGEEIICHEYNLTDIVMNEKVNQGSTDELVEVVEEGKLITNNPIYELAFANHDGELKGCAIYKKKEVGILSYNSGRSGKEWVLKYLDALGNFHSREFKCHEYELSDIEMKPKK